MAWFGKKDPCAICGGKVKGIFPWKIDGQLICNDCHGIVDLPDGVENNMSIQDFQNYMIFRAQNQQLKNQFRTTNEVDFGFFGTKIVFDTANCLFCMDRNLDKTIFEGENIVSFSIREDSSLLFEGSAAGLRRYPSFVPDRAYEMMPQLNQIVAQKNIAETMDNIHRSRSGNNTPAPSRYIDLPEPFAKFYVEIKLKHPYFGALFAELKGPAFDDDFPNLNDYMCEYNNSAQVMEQLAMLLMMVSFPDAPVQDVGFNDDVANVNVQVNANNSAAVVADEIQQYKALMDQGLITAEEFAAKKRQLLGI